MVKKKSGPDRDRNSSAGGTAFPSWSQPAWIHHSVEVCARPERPEISVACSHISGRDRRQATLADERLQSLSDSSLHDRRRLLPADTGNPVTRRRRFVADRGDRKSVV